eukprot:CAMPEP_0184409956 /NCGR_PEP_ID=MMETSP0738-20130409/4482_1 /TAXON_ID=385413 /ORGANISM="Thalassiosira miniscula, Strain CCMP1093" /LENGTH=77 /DNA_ID=CAMNT_0026767799 /DNA_START=1 /DNA_END=231 /DNA_ORIENTATION=+
MTDLQRAKACVQAHHAALARATPDTVAACLAEHLTPDAVWRGMHPFHVQSGPAAVAEAFWGPLLRAMHRARRRGGGV